MLGVRVTPLSTAAIANNGPGRRATAAQLQRLLWLLASDNAPPAASSKGLHGFYEMFPEALENPTRHL
jgi:hypothetical protein